MPTGLEMRVLRLAWYSAAPVPSATFRIFSGTESTPDHDRNALPGAGDRLVDTLNTIHDPPRAAGGKHTLCATGNDAFQGIRKID